MTDRDAPVKRRYEHVGLLGTVIEVSVAAEDRQAADGVDARVVGEIHRLELLFSRFDGDSELCRWRRGEAVVVSPEFAELMGRALEWQVRSGGGFNPMVGELRSLWQRAATLGVVPTGAQLAEAATGIQGPRYEMVVGVPTATGDCRALDLNAIAKGFVVDRALDAAMDDEVVWVSVNAGGDLAHRGLGSVRVGIENPHRPYDNEPPLMTIELAGAALATSGLARRGFRVGGRWFGHVLDPRTGWPVTGIASISVVEADALTADVLATVAGVLDPAEAIEFLDGFAGAEGLVVDEDGGQWETTGWPDLLASRS